MSVEFELPLAAFHIPVVSNFRNFSKERGRFLLYQKYCTRTLLLGQVFALLFGHNWRVVVNELQTQITTRMQQYRCLDFRRQEADKDR